MDLFDQYETPRNSYDKLCDTENNENMMLIISMVSMLNKKFYSPVAFLIEYLKNSNVQNTVLKVTGCNKFEFVVLYLRNFPNVSKSRKLKRIIDECR